MRSSLLSLALVAVGLVQANGFSRRSPLELAARQIETCTGNSCSECFGASYRICSGRRCFDPTRGEFCCSDGTTCFDAGCCGSLGQGITGIDAPTSGAGSSDPSPSPTQDIPDATVTGLEPTSSQWDCAASDSNDECCAKGGSGSKWCSGNLLLKCYDPTEGECCSDGTTCLGKGCCAQNGATATTPDGSSRTSTRSNFLPGGGASSTGSSRAGNVAAAMPTGLGNLIVAAGGILGAAAML